LGQNLRVFDTVTIRVSDLAASHRFYELADAPESVVLEEASEPTLNLHIAFAVESRDAVDTWWQKLVDAGCPSDGEPGPRTQYHESYYGGFVLDPDGNSVEAVHHAGTEPSGIDHLWLRTDDMAAARALFEDVPDIGIRRDTPDRLTFGFDDRIGSFSFVPGELPTRNVVLGDVLV
jgi:catechol 2,3-dioxygenase-like lactoylglutathione lyase family enzyme